MSLVKRAAMFSRAAHQAVGQKRKYTGMPYYLHTYAVAMILADSGAASQEMLAAAYLHDTLEDTSVTYLDLLDEFGPVVADHVSDLTDRFIDPAIGNRAHRKHLERKRLAGICADSQTIKFADLIHNTESIVACDPDFARVYLAEKRALLWVMNKGDKKLWRKAWALMAKGEAEVSA